MRTDLYEDMRRLGEALEQIGAAVLRFSEQTAGRREEVEDMWRRVMAREKTT